MFFPANATELYSKTNRPAIEVVMSAAIALAGVVSWSESLLGKRQTLSTECTPGRESITKMVKSGHSSIVLSEPHSY